MYALQLKQSPEKLRQRNVIEILQNSLQDKPKRSLHGDQETYDEVRYKLIIDPSEDDSLSRLLLMYNILDPKKTRTFMCSDFPEDSQLQKVSSDQAYICGNLHCVVYCSKFGFSKVHCTHYICTMYVTLCCLTWFPADQHNCCHSSCCCRGTDRPDVTNR